MSRPPANGVLSTLHSLRDRRYRFAPAKTLTQFVVLFLAPDPAAAGRPTHLFGASSRGSTTRLIEMFLLNERRRKTGFIPVTSLAWRSTFDAMMAATMRARTYP